MTRGDALRKAIVVFDAIRRAASKGNAGLEPEKGDENSYNNCQEICDTLRKMLRELESGEAWAPEDERKIADWQKDVMEHGAPERMVF